MQKSTWAKLALLTTAILWGTSLTVVKTASATFQPNFILAIRFTLAALVLGIVFFRMWRNLDASYWKAGAIVGGCLFLAYAFQTYGLAHTTSGKNAFLTAVYCVIVPFLNWLIVKHKPDKYNLLAALICIVGIGMVSLGGTEAGGLTINIGDALTLVGGFFFAAHIVAVNKFADGRDIFLITTLQFAFFALYSWIGAIAFREPLPTNLSGTALWGLVYLVIFSSCGALLFQNIGQKYTAPATAAVILSLEAPFGVLTSVLVGEENLNTIMVLGFVLIFIAVICSETKFSFLRKGEKTKS